MGKLSIFWFRRDLRLCDNAGLYHALKSGEEIQPIFIFDRNILDKLEDKNDRRVSFIFQQIERLRHELEGLGASLWVYYSTPLDVISELAEKFNFQTLYANRDYEPYARQRDKEVFEFLASKGITFKAYKDHVIFEKSEITKDDGTAYTVFTPYSKRWKAKMNEFYLSSYPTELYLSNFKKSASSAASTLAEMGFEQHPEDWPSSEVDKEIIKNYHEWRDFPAKNGTTRMSVHLRFGTISIRALVRLAAKTNEKYLNELIWREFYQSILWHFPYVKEGCFKKEYDRIPWPANPEFFDAWCEGRTGYPIVDAGMRELNATGLMHNRVRMIVASFLVKDLLIDWRLGEAYFAQKLLDFELASNNGGWQWAAGCGVDAAPYFRIFNPYIQAEKFDPESVYIRKWVSELNTVNYPKPIVDHHVVKTAAIELYKSVLKAG